MRIEAGKAVLADSEQREGDVFVRDVHRSSTRRFRRVLPFDERIVSPSDRRGA